MATFHELQTQQRIALDDLGELEAAVEALIETLHNLNETEADNDDIAEHHDRLAWLHRQRAGLLVVLSETERALLAADSRDDTPTTRD